MFVGLSAAFGSLASSRIMLLHLCIRNTPHIAMTEDIEMGGDKG